MRRLYGLYQRGKAQQLYDEDRIFGRGLPWTNPDNMFSFVGTARLFGVTGFVTNDFAYGKEHYEEENYYFNNHRGMSGIIAYACGNSG